MKAKKGALRRLGLLAQATVLIGLLPLPGIGGEIPHMARDPVPMIIIPQGPFLMGSSEDTGRSDEAPQRTVTLDAFAIDQVEVSNARYLAFVRATGHQPPMNPYENGALSAMEGIHDLPVVQVTWHDAFDYCHWAGKRLPTEAEWEKSARGTNGQQFPWGNLPPTPHRANFGRDWDGIQTLRPVGSIEEDVSFYGVNDMAGNVREWVQDWYHPDYYRTSPDQNPRGPENGILKVIRGGSWHNEVNSLRASSRGKGGFALKTDGLGFRCSRSVSLKK